MYKYNNELNASIIKYSDFSSKEEILYDFVWTTYNNNIILLYL